VGLTVPQLSGAAFVGLWLATALAVWSLVTYFVNVGSHFLAPPTKRD
jgi:hypothetical protein